MEYTDGEVRPYLVWDMGQRSEVQSEEQLTHLIEQVVLEAQNDMPFTVEIRVSKDTGLSMVVGLNESHMEFYSESEGPLVVGCKGPWNTDELIAFLHWGEYTEMPRKFWVPFSSAKVAFFEYFRTGKRPNNIQWNDI